MAKEPRKLNEAQFYALSLLAGMYPHEIPTDNPATVEAWARYIVDIPGDTLLSIVDEWNRHERRAPKAADLLDRFAARKGEDGETAWNRVLSILRSGGFRDREQMNAPPKERGFTGDPVLEEAVQAAGGWARLAAMEEKNLVFAKRDFLAAFAKETAKRATDQTLTDGMKELTDGNDDIVTDWQP